MLISLVVIRVKFIIIFSLLAASCKHELDNSPREIKQQSSQKEFLRIIFLGPRTLAEGGGVIRSLPSILKSDHEEILSKNDTHIFYDPNSQAEIEANISNDDAILHKVLQQDLNAEVVSLIKLLKPRRIHLVFLTHGAGPNYRGKLEYKIKNVGTYDPQHFIDLLKTIDSKNTGLEHLMVLPLSCFSYDFFTTLKNEFDLSTLSYAFSDSSMMVSKLTCSKAVNYTVFSRNIALTSYARPNKILGEKLAIDQTGEQLFAILKDPKARLKEYVDIFQKISPSAQDFPYQVSHNKTGVKVNLDDFFIRPKKIEINILTLGATYTVGANLIIRDLVNLHIADRTLIENIKSIRLYNPNDETRRYEIGIEDNFTFQASDTLRVIISTE